jgi:chromosome segregation ATPase
VEYFNPGLRELNRIAGRCIHRVRLALAQRRLAAAETELGLLGWQQADFDEHTERQVDEIQHVEREQARLHNASAELAQKVHSLTAERTRMSEQYDAQRARIEPERDKVRALLAEIGGRLATLRKREAQRERRGEEIGREQRKLEKQHENLLTIQPQTLQVRDDLTSLRKLQLEFVEELAEQECQRALVATDIEKDAKEYAECEQQCAAFDRQLRDLASASETAEAKFAEELRELEKEKARLATEVDKLESAKLYPYREIGRVLADSGVAPANQPEALNRVRNLRLMVQDYIAAIAASCAHSAQEDRTQLGISLALLAIIFVAIALLVGSIL